MEEKINLLKEQSPWVEEIQENGEIDFDKLLYLLTSFRNIPKSKWNDFDDLEGVIDRLGQGNLTTLMRKVKIITELVPLKTTRTFMKPETSGVHIQEHSKNSIFLRRMSRSRNT